MFKYSGDRFNEDFTEFVGIKKYECFRDSRDSYMNVIIFTFRQIRPTSLKATIDHYNESKLSDKSKIIVRRQSEFDDEIMTLSRNDGWKSNGFYLRILAAKECQDPSYHCWTYNPEDLKKVKLHKQLHIDMAKPFDSSPGRAKRPAGLLLETESEGDEPPVGDGGAPGDSVAKPKGRVKLLARRLQPGDKGYRSLESRMLDCAVTLATRMPVPQGSPPLAAARAVEAQRIPEFSLVPPADGQAAFSLAPVAPVVPVAPVAQDHQELMAKIYGLEKDNAVLAKTEEMLTLVVESKNECIKQAVGRVDAKDQHIRDLMEAKDKLIDILARGSHQ